MDRNKTAAGCGRLTTGLAGGANWHRLVFTGQHAVHRENLGERAASIPSARRHAPPGRIAVMGFAAGSRRDGKTRVSFANR